MPYDQKYHDEITDRLALEGHVTAHAEALGICSGMADMDYGFATRLASDEKHFELVQPTGVFYHQAQGVAIETDYDHMTDGVVFMEYPEKSYRLDTGTLQAFITVYNQLCQRLTSEANRLIDEDEGEGEAEAEAEAEGGEGA